MPINAYAAGSPGAPLQKFSYEPAPLGPEDIEIKITHCGICHSDVHLINNDWQVSEYPMVPGHEIVGRVAQLGSAVRRFEVGQRVGIGWQRSACLQCENCLRGDDNLCSQSQATCRGNYGGFAEAIRIDSRFAFAVPDKLTSENAAPLLCGGITVFSPLRHFGVVPQMRVGVIGIGGLGHMALQFAAAFGCEVTAFSSTPGKEREAREFGALRFVSSTDPQAMTDAAGTLDFILSTVNADLDWAKYLEVLRPNGRLCIVGVPPRPISVPAFGLIMGRRSICGSPIGSRSHIREMLEFAARHGVAAKTESLPMSEVNAALEKVKTNRARYRMVLEAGK